MEVDLGTVRGSFLDAKREQAIALKLGRSIALARQNAGLTQEEVAEKIGIGKEQISRIERGVAFPTVTRLYELAELFRCPVDTFLRKSSDLVSDQEATLKGLFTSIKDPTDRAFLLNMVEQISKHLRQKR